MIFEIIVTFFLLMVCFFVVTNKAFSPLLKIILVLVFLSGLYLAYNPETLDKLANYLGVDKGSDLIFYISTMLIIYSVLVIYHKIMQVNKKIEELDRSMAIANAKKPDRV